MINPSILKHLRTQKGLTQADLQERSKVDKQTISMIERGQRRRVRGHTIAAISKALGVAPAVLEGHTPIGDVDWEHRSALTVRLDDGPRNALTLASMRYGVPADAIVELAPFLFTWVAEMSLRRRAERVEAFELTEAELEAMQANFPHLDYLLTRSSVRYDIIDSERKSIAARDVFAYKMAGDDLTPGLAEDFEEFEGPIVKLLQDLAKQIEPTAEFESWHPLGGPAYAICKDEAAAIVGGDAELADEIIGGNVRLHKMPPELRKAGRLVDRIAWARSEAADAAERREALAGITLEDLDISLQDASS